MIQNRFVATPWGVRKDWVTPSGECIFSEYLPNSAVTGLAGPDDSGFWRRIAILSIVLVLAQGLAFVLLILASNFTI